MKAKAEDRNSMTKITEVSVEAQKNRDDLHVELLKISLQSRKLDDEKLKAQVDAMIKASTAHAKANPITYPKETKGE